MPFTIRTAVATIENLASALEEEKDRLTDLDSAVGDADHGINMNRGIRRALEKVHANSYSNFGLFFRDVAMSVMGWVGGSAGPLYAAFFMHLGKNLAQASEVSAAQLADAMQSGLEGVALLGQSARGDKTMLDTLFPAVEALQGGISSGEAEAWKRAVEAAREGMLSTAAMRARRGRSSNLAGRSIGHQDPGATSAFLLIKAFGDACVRNRQDDCADPPARPR